MRIPGSILFASTAAAARLFVSSYDGNITTLSLTTTAAGLQLEPIARQSGCAPTPSWLELGQDGSTIYCAEENWSDPAVATVSSYSINQNGSLTQISEIPTLNGGVSTTIYADGRALAVAHYGGSGLSVISLENPDKLALIEMHNMTNSTPGTHERQKAPYLHQVVLDPFEKHLFTPAFGTDQVHWWKIDPATHKVNHAGHLQVAPGSGPRHGVFYVPEAKNKSIKYFLVTELTNMLHGFEIEYTGGGEDVKGWKSIYNSTVFADGIKNPESTFAAEIAVSPNNKHLIISTRNDTTFSIPNNDSRNATLLPSDSLITFEIADGGRTLRKVNQAPAGGIFPRHFSLNKQGDLVAVALQLSNKVAVLKRDIDTGVIGDVVASVMLEGANPSSVLWEETEEEPDQESKATPTLSKDATSPTAPMTRSGCLSAVTESATSDSESGDYA